MSIYIIRDSEGNEINRIKANSEFVTQHFEFYEIYVDPTKVTREAREWRDTELSLTDQAAQIPDWPNRDAILVYRQALRDWPSTENFPEIRPELGV